MLIREITVEREAQILRELVDRRVERLYRQVSKYNGSGQDEGTDQRTQAFAGFAGIPTPTAYDLTVQRLFDPATQDEVREGLAWGLMSTFDRIPKEKLVQLVKRLHAEESRIASTFVTALLMYQMDDWQDDTDRLLFLLPLVGTVFRKTFWSSLLNRPASELVLPTDLIVNYFATDWERCRKTHAFLKDRNTIIEQQRAGNYLDVALPDTAVVPHKESEAEQPNAAPGQTAVYNDKDVPFSSIVFMRATRHRDERAGVRCSADASLITACTFT